MKIGIDIDNVITNTTECVLDYINERLPNVNFKVENVKEYWLEKIMPEGYEWIINQAFSDKQMWKKVELIDGAAQYIRQLRLDGHEVYFVTSTTSDNFRKKIKFLQRNLYLPPNYAENHTISIKKKQLLNIHFLVDDYLNNLTGNREYYSICLDYPWNRNFNDNDEEDFVRVKNWEEIYYAIKEKVFEMQGLFK